MGVGSEQEEQDQRQLQQSYKSMPLSASPHGSPGATANLLEHHNDHYSYVLGNSNGDDNGYRNEANGDNYGYDDGRRYDDGHVSVNDAYGNGNYSGAVSDDDGGDGGNRVL